MKTVEDKTPTPTPEIVSVNTWQMNHDIPAVQIQIGQINEALKQAYSLGMMKLEQSELSFIELIYLNGSIPLKNRMEASVRNSNQVINLPVLLQDETIRLHMLQPGIAELLKAAENCKYSYFNRMPISFSYCQINEIGLLELGNMDKIRQLYSTYINTPARREFYNLSQEVAERLTRLYELSQKSEKLGFNYYDPGDFINRTSDLFTYEGERVKVQGSWIENI